MSHITTSDSQRQPRSALHYRKTPSRRPSLNIHHPPPAGICRRLRPLGVVCVRLCNRLMPVAIHTTKTSGSSRSQENRRPLQSDYYPHMPIGKVWIYRLLFVCTVTDFSAKNKASGVTFCSAVYLRPKQGIDRFCELCSTRSPKLVESASA